CRQASRVAEREPLSAGSSRPVACDCRRLPIALPRRVPFSYSAPTNAARRDTGIGRAAFRENLRRLFAWVVPGIARFRQGRFETAFPKLAIADHVLHFACQRIE